MTLGKLRSATTVVHLGDGEREVDFSQMDILFLDRAAHFLASSVQRESMTPWHSKRTDRQ